MNKGYLNRRQFFACKTRKGNGDNSNARVPNYNPRLSEVREMPCVGENYLLGVAFGYIFLGAVLKGGIN